MLTSENLDNHAIRMNEGILRRNGNRRETMTKIITKRHEIFKKERDEQQRVRKNGQ